jgi:hypothetical protein
MIAQPFSHALDSVQMLTPYQAIDTLESWSSSSANQTILKNLGLSIDPRRLERLERCMQSTKPDVAPRAEL